MAYGRQYKRKIAVRKRNSVRKGPFKKYNSKALVAKAKTRSLVKLIKGVTLKEAETCYKTMAISSITVNHNTITQREIWNDAGTTGFWPSQGSGDGERRGDEILTQGFKIRGILQIPPDRRATIVKMWYLPYDFQSQGNPATYSNLFHNVVGSVMCDPIQTDRWPGIKYLGSYRVIARDLVTNEDSATIIINKWVSMKKKVKFVNDGVAVASNCKPLGVLLFTAYDAVGTLTTDTLVSNGQIGITLYYKDP